MADSFLVRPAIPADEAAVGALLAACFPVLMPTHYAAEVLAAALPKMTRPNPALLSSGTYYVAEAGGAVVGCGGWTREHPGTGEVVPGLGHIRHFATHPDWLRQGVGRAIYNRCAVDARAAGVVRLECYASLNAEGFYAELGFETIRPVAVDMGDGLHLPSILVTRPI